MEVVVEALVGLAKKLTVTIPAEQLEGKVQEQLGQISTQSRVKGFRPGKAPVATLKKRMGSSVHQQIALDYMQKALPDIFKAHKLNPVVQPKINITRLNPGESVECVAEFEEYPEMTLANLSTLKVERLTTKVTSEAMTDTLEKLRHQHAAWEEKAEAAVKGDRVDIDFEGTIDGTAFAGGAGKGISVDLGAGSMLPDFEAQLMGATSGAAIQITVTFPTDYHAAALAGKEAVFATQVHKVFAPALPELDVEFVKKLGFEAGGVGAFREEIRKRLLQAAEAHAQKQLKNTVTDLLLKKHDWPLPQVLVRQEIEALEAQFKAQKKQHPEAVWEADKMIERARLHVRRSLLFRALVERYKIEVTEQDLLQHIEDHFGSYGDMDQAKAWFAQDQSRVAQLRATIFEEKALAGLLGEVKVVDKEVPYDTLVKGDMV